jgi:hypothetical protein
MLSFPLMEPASTCFSICPDQLHDTGYKKFQQPQQHIDLARKLQIAPVRDTL